MTSPLIPARRSPTSLGSSPTPTANPTAHPAANPAANPAAEAAEDAPVWLAQALERVAQGVAQGVAQALDPWPRSVPLWGQRPFQERACPPHRIIRPRLAHPSILSSLLETAV